MKHILPPLLCGLSLAASAQTPSVPTSNQAITSSREYSVSARGPHHRVWQRVEYEPGLWGRPVPKVKSYTELSTGMHYLEDGNWVESKEQIEVLEGRAVARQGQHKVSFAPDLATAGAIEVETPAGIHLRSHILGLSYFDTSSGQSVLIAEVKSSAGEVQAPNVVIYPDAFTDLEADVRYTYTRAGLEQDVILREQPASPEKFGLNARTTRLQVLTEFVNPPVPARSTVSVKEGSDDTLDFGQWRSAPGKAYLEAAGVSVGGSDVRTGERVTKQWLKLEGRDFLVEEVQFPAVQKSMESLPKRQASLGPQGGKKVRVAKLAAILPKKPGMAKQSPPRFKQLELASAKPPRGGYVLDYQFVNGSGNYTFRSDTTYFVTNGVNFYGSVVFEGGTVIKYAPVSAITIYGSASTKGGSYRPVILTARDDNTVGQNVPGSTGSPGTNRYAATALVFYNNPFSLENVRFSYLKQAIALDNGAWNTLRDCQFVNCDKAVDMLQCDLRLENVLMYGISSWCFQSDGQLSLEHLTVNQSPLLVKLIDPEYPPSIHLTNSLLTSVTTIGMTNYDLVSSYWFTNNPGVFQTVGAAAHYLATNSPYRNVGTTNIGTNLLAALRTKTTYPPMVFSNATYSSPTTLASQAQRDTDVPDLGFHYDPIDYAFGGTTIATNLTFQPGTKVAWFRTATSDAGIYLNNYLSMNFDGRVDEQCGFVRNNTVQEQANANWGAQGGHAALHGLAAEWEELSTVSMQFTRCAAVADELSYVSGYYGVLKANFKNCELYGGQVSGWVVTVGLTNCLLHGTHIGLEGGIAQYFALHNCTMREGSYYMNRWPEEYGSPGTGLVPVIITDTAFDSVTFWQTDDVHKYDGYTSYDYNAFIYGENRTDPNGTHDVIVTNSFNWQTSWLGNFYLPTNSTLVNAGSLSSAADAGLYHFTLMTNQVKETTSRLDMGYHYVAVTNGVPIDTDGDGVPDYLEDADGDGNVDAGENSWLSYNSPNGLTPGSGLRVFTPLR